MSMKYIPQRRINNNLALVQMMARRRTDKKPLPKAMAIYWLIYVSLDLDKSTLWQ